LSVSDNFVEPPSGRTEGAFPFTLVPLGGVRISNRIQEERLTLGIEHRLDVESQPKESCQGEVLEFDGLAMKTWHRHPHYELWEQRVHSRIHKRQDLTVRKRQEEPLQQTGSKRLTTSLWMNATENFASREGQ
jgi:hypothetical protein